MPPSPAKIPANSGDPLPRRPPPQHPLLLSLIRRVEPLNPTHHKNPSPGSRLYLEQQDVNLRAMATAAPRQHVELRRHGDRLHGTGQMRLASTPAFTDDGVLMDCRAASSLFPISRPGVLLFVPHLQASLRWYLLRGTERSSGRSCCLCWTTHEYLVLIRRRRMNQRQRRTKSRRQRRTKSRRQRRKKVQRHLMHPSMARRHGEGAGQRCRGSLGRRRSEFLEVFLEVLLAGGCYSPSDLEVRPQQLESWRCSWRSGVEGEASDWR